MKYASVGLGAVLLLGASPAFATQSLECQSPGRRGFEMFVSVGSGGGVDLVRIVEGRREMVAAYPRPYPRIARGFLTESGRLSVRLVGRDGRTPVAIIDARAARRAYAGTLRYRRRVWRISCRWEPQD